MRFGVSFRLLPSEKTMTTIYVASTEAFAGKTSLAMNIAEHMALVNRIGVAVFSLEMPREQIALRFLSSHSRIQTGKIRRWTVNEEEKSRIMTSANTIREANLFIDDSTSLSVFDLRSRLRRLSNEESIQIVFVK